MDVATDGGATRLWTSNAALACILLWVPFRRLQPFLNLLESEGHTTLTMDAKPTKIMKKVRAHSLQTER